MKWISGWGQTPRHGMDHAVALRMRAAFINLVAGYSLQSIALLHSTPSVVGHHLTNV